MLGKGSCKGKGEKVLSVPVVNESYITVKEDPKKKWARRSKKLILLKTKCDIITSILLWNFFILCYIFLCTKPEKNVFFLKKCHTWLCAMKFSWKACTFKRNSDTNDLFFYVADKSSHNNTGIQISST